MSINGIILSKSMKILRLILIFDQNLKFFYRNSSKKYMLTPLDGLISIILAKYICFKHMFAILRCDSVLYSQNRQNSEVWY